MNDIIIRTMTIDDYDDVAALWAGIKGFGIRSIDDSREGIGAISSQKSQHQCGGGDGWQGCWFHSLRT